MQQDPWEPSERIVKPRTLWAFVFGGSFILWVLVIVLICGECLTHVR